MLTKDKIFFRFLPFCIKIVILDLYKDFSTKKTKKWNFLLSLNCFLIIREFFLWQFMSTSISEILRSTRYLMGPEMGLGKLGPRIGVALCCNHHKSVFPDWLRLLISDYTLCFADYAPDAPCYPPQKPVHNTFIQSGAQNRWEISKFVGCHCHSYLTAAFRLPSFLPSLAVQIDIAAPPLTIEIPNGQIG